MRIYVLAFTLLPAFAHADPGCPPVSFTSARSATLTPSPGVHRVLLKQSDGSYTAFELNDTAPYRILRTIPHFEKQLSACSPSQTGLPRLGLLAVAPVGSRYIFATQDAFALFDAQLNLVSTASYAHILAPLVFADVNGDGIPDLIGTTVEIAHEQVLSVALGIGGVNFQPPVSYTAAGGLSSITGVAVADVNGDHKPDIVVSTIFDGSILLFIGNGDGTFQPAKALATPNSPNSVTLADLNGDGKPDLVYSDLDPSDDTAVVEIALGAGNGTFAKPVAYRVAGDGFTIGDVNGDGIPDIVANGITILFGDGKGGFSERRDVLVEATGDLIIADFDGDGIPDIVVGTGSPQIIAGDSVTVLSGLGMGRFRGPPVSLAPTQFDVLATADVNGDGIPDLLSTASEHPVSVLLGVGDGSFQRSFQYTFTSGLLYAAGFGDFNKDGKPDLAVVGGGSAPGGPGDVDILLGNGDGTFQSPNHVAAPAGAFALATADFNGDGKLDFAVLGSQAGAAVPDSVLILLGRGDGTFIAGATYAVGPVAGSLVAGDFNGDGKPDLIVANQGTNALHGQDGNISLLAGNGDGTFREANIMGLGITTDIGPYSVVASDFNGDGKLDLAVTVSAGATGGLLTMLGNGDGTFEPPAYYAVDAANVYSGDLNGDRIPDLIVSSASGIRYLLGNGDGSFAPPGQFSSDGFTLYSGSPLALADFNLDGKLDVAAIDSTGIATFLNEAAWTQSLTVVSAASLTPGPIAPDSIATAFGEKLSGGVTITDITGNTFPASVLYASPAQINFVIPPGLDAGPATVTIQGATATVLIAPVAPSLFTVNANGLAAGYVTRAGTNEQIKDGIDVTSGDTYLILFGTGIRNSGSIQASSGQVTYAGPQPTFAGLDQVNLLLPASLAGSGCINLSIKSEYLASNTVFVCIK